MCQVGTLRFILLLPQPVVHGTDTKGCLLCISVILTASTIKAFDTSGVRTGSEKAKHTESPSVTANSFLAAPREKVTTDRLNRVGRIEWLLGSVWVTLSTGGENKFLGLNVSEDLSWSQKQWDNNSSFCSCWGGLRRFYQRDFKSILSGCIVILHWMVRSSQCITKKKKKAKKNRWILYARVKLS